MQTLTDEQRAPIKHLLANPNGHIVLTDAKAGTGKAQPVNEKVLTPTGWKLMGNIIKGMQVIGSDGKPTTITEVYPQGVRPIYTVEFIDGTKVNCDIEHIWTVRQRSKNMYGNTYTTVTVREMLKSWISKKSYDKRYGTYQNTYNFSIPTVAACEFTNNEQLPIDPYAMGLLLGDGGFTGNNGSIRFTNSSKKLCKKLKNLLEPQFTINKMVFSDGSWNMCISKGTSNITLATLLDQYGLNNKLSVEKHIPKAYLYSSLENRKALWQGLTDTDGYVNSKGEVLEYSTSSKQLAEDYLELSRSIGKVFTIHKRIPKFNDANGNKKEGHTSYRLRQMKNKPKSIVSITYSHREEAQCIKVSAKDSLYVTSGFNLTHNTHTATKTVEALNPKKGLYTAFNKSIVTEAVELYANTPIECRTLHALALSKVKPKLPIEDFTYTCIKEDISYFQKNIIIKAIDEFYRSSSLDSEEFLKNHISTLVNAMPNSPKLDKNKTIFLLTALANSYIDKMINDEINPTFNYLLKWFHFMLANNELELGYDLVIFDEIQDSTAVALEIFKLLPAKYKLGLGDQDQAIYLFMNLVNGFELLDNSVTFSLTQSFRCSEPIAEAVEAFGKKYLHTDFHFRGIKHPMQDGKTAYITATNSAIVSIINDLHREGRGYILTRPIKEIFAAPLAVLTAGKGKAVFHKKYKYLENEFKRFKKSQHNSFMAYLTAEVDDEEIRQTVKLLQSFIQKRINIFDVMAEAKRVKRDPTVTVGTGFSLKGLGYETVYIDESLNTAMDRIVNAGGPQTPEDYVVCKLYYVSCTRSRVNLHNARHLFL